MSISIHVKQWLKITCLMFKSYPLFLFVLPRPENLKNSWQFEFLSTSWKKLFSSALPISCIVSPECIANGNRSQKSFASLGNYSPNGNAEKPSVCVGRLLSVVSVGAVGFWSIASAYIRKNVFLSGLKLAFLAAILLRMNKIVVFCDVHNIGHPVNKLVFPQVISVGQCKLMTNNASTHLSVVMHLLYDKNH